jgi:hypothetical protein
MKNKIKLSLITTALLIGSLSFPAISLADNQEPILIEIKDTDIGTAAYEQLISHGNGGHAAIGAILGNAQSMSSNPGIGFSIGSGGNGYRPSIIIAVWTDQSFSASTGLATIKSHFNVPSNPVTTNGDCAIACDGTTQVEEVVTTTTIAPTTTIAVTPITTTTTVAPTTTLPEVVAPTQVSQSPQTTQPEPVQSQPQPIVYNTEPYTAPTTTTTTVVETVNVSSAYTSFVLSEELISSISKPKVIKPKFIKPKVIKSNKAKKVLTKIK